MATKLLLKEDVEALGRKGDIVSVKPGYARNFLLPQGLGLIADKNALRVQETLRQERMKQAVVDKKDAEELAAKLKDLTISTTVKVDQMGHMYGSVSAHDLHAMLQNQHGIILGKRDIQLKHAIKKTGIQTINVKLKEGVESSFKAEITAEGYVAPAEVPKAEAAEGSSS